MILLNIDKAVIVMNHNENINQVVCFPKKAQWKVFSKNSKKICFNFKCVLILQYQVNTPFCGY